MAEVGVLDRTLGRYHKSGPLRGQPMDHDLVHLGTGGIKRFVLNMKAIVIKSKNTPRPEQPVCHGNPEMPHSP